MCLSFRRQTGGFVVETILSFRLLHSTGVQRHHPHHLSGRREPVVRQHVVRQHARPGDHAAISEPPEPVAAHQQPRQLGVSRRRGAPGHRGRQPSGHLGRCAHANLHHHHCLQGPVKAVRLRLDLTPFPSTIPVAPLREGVTPWILAWLNSLLIVSTIFLLSICCHQKEKWPPIRLGLFFFSFFFLIYFEFSLKKLLTKNTFHFYKLRHVY